MFQNLSENSSFLENLNMNYTALTKSFIKYIKKQSARTHNQKKKKNVAMQLYLRIILS